MGRWWHWPIITTTSGTSNSSNNYRSFFEQWPWSLEWSRLCRGRWIRIWEDGGSPSESRKRHVNKTRWTWNLHRRFETSTQCGACRRTLEWRRWAPENNLDVAGQHQQSRHEKSRNKDQSFPKDRRFFQNDGKSRRTTWHEQCDHSQVQKFRRCVPFQDMTAHFGQNYFAFGCTGMWATPGYHNAHLEAQYAATIPMRATAEFNSGLMQNCEAYSFGRSFEAYSFRMRLLLAACQSAMAGRENCEQLGRFETLQVEEECESFLLVSTPPLERSCMATAQGWHALQSRQFHFYVMTCEITCECIEALRSKQKGVIASCSSAWFDTVKPCRTSYARFDAANLEAAPILKTSPVRVSVVELEINFTPYALRSALDTLHLTPRILYFTLYTLHTTLYASHSTLYAPHSTLHSWHPKPQSPHSTLHFTRHTVYFTLCTPHSTFYSLHPTL